MLNYIIQGVAAVQTARAILYRAQYAETLVELVLLVGELNHF